MVGKQFRALLPARMLFWKNVRPQKNLHKKTYKIQNLYFRVIFMKNFRHKTNFRARSALESAPGLLGCLRVHCDGAHPESRARRCSFFHVWESFAIAVGVRHSSARLQMSRGNGSSDKSLFPLPVCSKAFPDCPISEGDLPQWYQHLRQGKTAAPCRSMKVLDVVRNFYRNFLTA